MAGQYLDRADTEMTQYGLSARAPFFNNGSAQTLLDAVHFYEKPIWTCPDGSGGIGPGRVLERSLNDVHLNGR